MPVRKWGGLQSDMNKQKIILRNKSFTPSDSARRKLKSYLKNFEISELPDNSIYLSSGENHIDLEIELFSKKYLLELLPNDLRTSNCRSASNGNILEKRNPCRTFKGVVKNTDQSVRLLINEKGLSGYIQLKDQKLFIEKNIKFGLSDRTPLSVIAYYENDIIFNDDFHCGVTLEEEKKFIERLYKNPDDNLKSSSCNFLKIATEADYPYYQSYGVNTNDEILGIINQIEDIYMSTFNVALRVTFQHVWTSNDPYTGDPSTSPGGLLLLNQLKNYWETNFGNIDRDVVHLFTNGSLGGGTVAGMVMEIGSICVNPSNCYGYTKEALFDFLTTAHEIGHQFGGIHSDGENCGTSDASIMCQGTKAIPMYFSAASISRISNFISTNNTCMDPSLFFNIEGDPLICSVQQYSIPDLSPLDTSTWTVLPSNSVTVSGSGNSRTLTRASGYNGAVILNVDISMDCGTVSISKDLFAGVEAGATVDGMTMVPTNQINTYVAQYLGMPESGITSFSWFVIPPPGGGGGINEVQFGVAEAWFDTVGVYEVGVNIFNPCGYFETPTLAVSVVPSPFTIKSNQKKDEIFISLNSDIEVKEQIETFTIEVLDSNEQILHKMESKGKELIVDTSAHSDDTIILLIYYGDKIEKRIVAIRDAKK